MFQQFLRHLRVALLCLRRGRVPCIRLLLRLLQLRCSRLHLLREGRHRVVSNEADQFLIAARVALQAVSARRVVVLLDSFLVAVAPCIRRALSPEALREQLAPALASVRVSAPVQVSVPRVPEWAAPPAVLYHLRVKRRVHSVRAAHSVVGASNTRRQKKAR